MQVCRWWLPGEAAGQHFHFMQGMQLPALGDNSVEIVPSHHVICYLGVKNFLLHFLLVTDDLNVFLTWRALLIPGSAVRKYSLVSDSTIYVKIDGDCSHWLGRDVFLILACITCMQSPSD